MEHHGVKKSKKSIQLSYHACDRNMKAPVGCMITKIMCTILKIEMRYQKIKKIS